MRICLCEPEQKTSFAAIVKTNVEQKFSKNHYSTSLLLSVCDYTRCECVRMCVRVKQLFYDFSMLFEKNLA